MLAHVSLHRLRRLTWVNTFHKYIKPSNHRAWLKCYTYMLVSHLSHCTCLTRQTFVLTVLVVSCHAQQLASLILQSFCWMIFGVFLLHLSFWLWSLTSAAALPRLFQRKSLRYCYSFFVVCVLHVFHACLFFFVCFHLFIIGTSCPSERCPKKTVNCYRR